MIHTKLSQAELDDLQKMLYSAPRTFNIRKWDNLAARAATAATYHPGIVSKLGTLSERVHVVHARLIDESKARLGQVKRSPMADTPKFLDYQTQTLRRLVKAAHCRPGGGFISMRPFKPVGRQDETHWVHTCKQRPCPHCHWRRVHSAAEHLQAWGDRTMALEQAAIQVPPEMTGAKDLRNELRRHIEYLRQRLRKVVKPQRAIWFSDLKLWQRDDSPNVHRQLAIAVIYTTKGVKRQVFPPERFEDASFQKVNTTASACLHWLPQVCQYQEWLLRNLALWSPYIEATNNLRFTKTFTAGAG